MVVEKDLLLIYRNNKDLRIFAEKLHDGQAVINPPTKVTIPVSLEQDKGIVSRLKCLKNSCAFSRDALEIDLVTFEIEAKGIDQSLKIESLKTFMMYKGFNLDSLEMNEDYIVASGCQIYDTVNFSIDEVTKMDYNDECGVLVFDSKAQADSAG